MIRIAWPLLLIAIGALAAMVQLDRQARYSPDLARLVPVYMGGFARYHRAARSLEQGDLENGVREAEQLVANRPIPAENLRLYAQAQLLAGDEEEAARAFQMAARRGWREPMAQEVQLRLAWAAGDAAEAGRRLAALWAISPDKAKLAELAQLVLENPEGRASFAQILADSPRWNRRFAALGPSILPQELFDKIRREARLD